MDDIHKATMAKLTHAYLIILFLFYNNFRPRKAGKAILQHISYVSAFRRPSLERTDYSVAENNDFPIRNPWQKKCQGFLFQTKNVLF